MNSSQGKAIYHAGMVRVKTTKEPEGQKYHIGERVKIADKLEPGKSHFPSGLEATVQYTYAHAFGGGDIKSYSVVFDNGNSCAWYDEEELSLIAGPIENKLCGGNPMIDKTKLRAVFE